MAKAYGVSSEKPLQGIRVLLLRERLGSENHRLKRLGAQVVHAPVLIKKSLLKAGREDQIRLFLRDPRNWLVFTSASGVKEFLKFRHFPRPCLARVACIGPGTADVVRRCLGKKADFIPSAFTSNRLGRELPVKSGVRVLLVRSANADELMDRVLMKRGAQVTRLNSYELHDRPLSREIVEQLKKKKVTHIFFGSRSQVEALDHGLSVYMPLGKVRTFLKGIHCCSIGPETSTSLRQRRWPYQQAGVHTFDGLIDLLVP